MTKAVVLRTTGEVETITLPEQDGGYEVIRDTVGGYIDAVRAADFVGYVHDEGLLIGLAPNIMASMLFERPIMGEVVIVGCVNENGVYDGENYDVPEIFLTEKFARTCLGMAQDESLAEAVFAQASRLLDEGPKVYAVTDDEFDRWLDTGEMPDRDPD